MTGLLDHYLVDTCQLVTVTRTKYGDYKKSLSADEPCRYRPINSFQRVTFQEVKDADAMFWFRPNSTVTVGSILYYGGIYYQVERMTLAKRLGETTIQFKKCDVKVTDINIS